MAKKKIPKEILKKVESDDDKNWETVIDFTKFKRGGIDVKELIRRLSYNF